MSNHFISESVKKNNSRNSNWGRKGVMDDMFDFLFTVVGAILLFMFISWVFNGSIDTMNQATMYKTEGVRGDQSAATMLKSPLIYKDQQLTTYSFILLFLEGKTVSENDFKQMIDAKIAQYFPESYNCGYILRLGEQTYSDKYNYMVKGQLSGCPWLVIIEKIYGTKEYKLHLQVGPLKEASAP